MHLMTSNIAKLATRFINKEPRLAAAGISSILKECGRPMKMTIVSAAGVNLEQRRYYDREKVMDYSDRRYQKEYDFRYDKPSGWTVHPNFKLRMHLEEHSSLRGKSLLVLCVAMFTWLYLCLYIIHILPHPPAVGREPQY